MKISPPSGDMLIKLGIGVALFAGLGMVVWTIKSKTSAAATQANAYIDTALNAVNPTSQDNLAYASVNGIFSAAIPTRAKDNNMDGMNADGSWTLGGWLYDYTHPAIAWNVRNLNP